MTLPTAKPRARAIAESKPLGFAVLRFSAALYFSIQRSSSSGIDVFLCSLFRLGLHLTTLGEKLVAMIETRSRTRLQGGSQEIANVLAVQLDRVLSRRNPVPPEEFVQSASVNTGQRVQPMNAGGHLLHFYVVQSTGRDDEGWLSKLPCQT
jgi:hypothetical protein